jgi:nitrate/nitrite transport system ATP-binding protein
MSNYVKEHYLDMIGLSKIYPSKKGPFVVLEKFNLTIPQSEFVCLIGHSGCGKSTILSMVAGLNDISAGAVSVAGKEIVGPGPDRGVVFQSPSLLPWMTAYENVMLGVKKVYPHATVKQKDDIVQYYLHEVGLDGSFYKLPKELSQGMRQRVGIARAFAIKPKVMLLDEPLGMLDALTKHDLQDLIVKLHDEHKLTTLMVTHDVDEALYLSDRVVMMTNGPMATVGDILINDLPRPRERVDLMEHPNYYPYREHLITFLEEQEIKKKTIVA